jgi:hypothetical protein
MALIIPEAITNNGWEFHEKCKCTGVRKWKFRNKKYPSLELEWWISYYQFKIMDKNMTRVPLTKLAKLDEILKAL